MYDLWQNKALFIVKYEDKPIPGFVVTPEPLTLYHSRTDWTVTLFQNIKEISGQSVNYSNVALTYTYELYPLPLMTSPLGF